MYELLDKLSFVEKDQSNDVSRFDENYVYFPIFFTTMEPQNIHYDWFIVTKDLTTQIHHRLDAGSPLNPASYLFWKQFVGIWYVVHITLCSTHYLVVYNVQIGSSYQRLIGSFVSVPEAGIKGRDK